MRISRTFLPILYCLGIYAVLAQQPLPQTVFIGELQKLLSYPAPAPRTSQREENQQPKLQQYDRNDPPPLDAPAAELLDFWVMQNRRADSLTPSEAIRERLLTACESEPEKLPDVLALLPRTPESTKRVKRLYDEALRVGQVDGSWNKEVRTWLRLNSRYFLDELQAMARKTKDKNSYIENDEALEALAKIDWPSAEPLLQSLSGADPRTSALAISLLYRHAVDAQYSGEAERHRARLQTIAGARTAPARARDIAIEALSNTDWRGREEWYLSLLADETLIEPIDGNTMFSPLTTLFYRSPDRWIPVFARLVESPDRAIRHAAAHCLISYAIQIPRRDVILPVLRWLSDPEWLDFRSSTQRAWFIQKMNELDLPESVPGLIWIIENEPSNRQWAARTLIHYKDPRAIPVLKKVLLVREEEAGEQDLIQCLLASGGLSDADRLAALEAYAGLTASPEGRSILGQIRGIGRPTIDLQTAIGEVLALQKAVSDSLATLVLARTDALQKSDPARARALLAIAQQWQSRQIELKIVQQIATGTADAATISRGLEQRKQLIASAGSTLRQLTDGSGAARGIAAVLLEDAALAETILTKGDAQAQLALLACARLLPMALPIGQVGGFLKNVNTDLARAANLYLLAEDSPDARRTLLENHPNEAFITGWRENTASTNISGPIARREEELRKEVVSANGPREILALLADAATGHKILRFYDDRAVYTVDEDNARYREYRIPKSRLAEISNFFANDPMLESGPQFGYCHHDCIKAQFVSVTKHGGHRVFGLQSFMAWRPIIALFDNLETEAPAETHYYLSRKIKSLEILYQPQTETALDVWKQGDDLIVFIERTATKEEIEQDRKSAATEENNEDEVARVERKRQAAARNRALFSWRKMENGKPTESVATPTVHFPIDGLPVDVDPDEFPVYLNAALPQALAGDAVILARASEEGGLWKKGPSEPPVRVSPEGRYANPMTSPDGKWVIAAKTDSDWSKPNYVVRLHLPTRREYRIALPAADSFNVMAYVPAHNAFLLRRTREAADGSSQPVGPEPPEYSLLDPATGRTRLVTGEFAPLGQQGKRRLQPAGRPFEFWAAIPDRGKNETRIGRYNSKTFRFEPMMSVPELLFDSFAMYVDEKIAKLFIVYKGQVLQLPMSKAR